MKLAPALCALLAAVPVPIWAAASPVSLPAEASLAFEQVEPMSDYRLPVAAWADGRVAGVALSGRISRTSWHIPSEALSTLQILSPIRQQLADTGYDILFECASRECGGFDFRYEIWVIPEPDMHVDLGDFRFLAARKPGDEGDAEHISVLVSRSALKGFVQIVHAAPEGATPTKLAATSTKSPQPEAVQKRSFSNQMPMGEQLVEIGRVVLEDLQFERGSASLSEGPYPSLGELATILNGDPEKQVVLVGHTDAEGALDRNIALSRRRALAVRERLISQYEVSAGQITAQGVGFLAPLASNQSADGRTANRRVEAILSSIE